MKNPSHDRSDSLQATDPWIESLRDVEVPSHLEQRLESIPDRATKEQNVSNRSTQRVDPRKLLAAAAVLLAMTGLAGLWIATSAPSGTEPMLAEPNSQGSPAALPDKEDEAPEVPTNDLPDANDSAFDSSTQLEIERQVVEQMLRMQQGHHAQPGRQKTRAAWQRGDRLQTLESLAPTLITTADFQSANREVTDLAQESYRLVLTSFPDSPLANEAGNRLRRVP